MADAPMPLLRVRPSDVAPRALVVGDPARAAAAAALLDDAREVGRNREYATFTGRFGGAPVTVASHGIGAAGAAVCFEELARAGVRTMIRAGTCGALRDDLADGALVVATGAVRAEGLTAKLVPPGFPALADHRVVAALLAAAARAGVSHAAGIVLTEDRFYPSAAMPQDWRPWQASRVLAVEMETAALLVVAVLHGIRAGAVLTVDGNPTRAKHSDMSGYDPHREVVARGVATMLGVALEAIAGLEITGSEDRSPSSSGGS